MTVTRLAELDDAAALAARLRANRVSGSHNGRGLASAAVAEVIDLAFRGLGLHRLQAETLLHNTASQRGNSPQRLPAVRGGSVLPQDRW